MDNDDQPVGRVLNRREFLALISTLGASALAACTTPPGSSTPAAASPNAAATAADLANNLALPTCIVRPELTEGPFFLDNMLERSDIRSEVTDGALKAGALLTLIFKVTQIDGERCTPLPGAVVDVWHCDAEGVYSGVTDRNAAFDASQQTFLRGYQLTDAQGRAQFTTIYPGWYSGRTVHIHFKIRTAAGLQGTYDFTSQLFFDEALTDQVYTQEPYASRGPRNTLNADDGIYRASGEQLLLTTSASGAGYAATFDIGLDFA